MAKSDLILLALDESPIRQLLERALRATGYPIALVEDKISLDKALLETSPALIIIGETFKRLKGIELAADMLDRFPTLPIILFAEQNNPALLKQAMQLGLSDCFLPPVRMDDIVQTVENSMARARRTGDWVRREVKRTTASLEKRIGDLQTLVRMGRTITSSLDPEHVMAAVVNAAVDLSGAEEAFLILKDKSTGELRTQVEFKSGDSQAQLVDEPASNPTAEQVLTNGKPAFVRGSASDAGLIYVPLVILKRAIGILGVHNLQSSRPFDERHLLLVSLLADYASIAIENANLYLNTEDERKRFGTTLTHIQDGVMLLDQKERILVMNPIMQEALQLSQVDYFNENVLDIVEMLDMRSFIEGAKGYRLKHQFNLEDGRVFSAQYTPIPDVGAVITMQDITHLKKLDRVKSDFIQTVSHDLRSPLTAILGYAELLERVGPLNGTQQEFIRRVQSSVQNITMLVNDLLDLGRIEAGIDLTNDLLPMNVLVQLSIDNFSQQITHKNLSVTFNANSDVPSMRGNPIRMRQMLDNLFGNAVKYTPEGGNISIDLRYENEQVILQISDTGPGIPVADQPHIFDKFFRASNVPGKTVGSGLGLAIVKSIVESHQGRIWVESAVGLGSTFTVVLPAFTDPID